MRSLRFPAMAHLALALFVTSAAHAQTIRARAPDPSASASPEVRSPVRRSVQSAIGSTAGGVLGSSRINPSEQGAEMSMIELQSLVSKRAAALQLATGVARATNDANKDIFGNMGNGGSSGNPGCRTCVGELVKK